MDDWLLIVLMVVGVVIVGALVYWAATSGRAKRIEHKREQADETREQARARAQAAGEKDLEARRLAEQAQEERAAAQELDREAAEIDPDGARTR